MFLAVIMFMACLKVASGPIVMRGEEDMLPTDVFSVERPLARQPLITSLSVTTPQGAPFLSTTKDQTLFWIILFTASSTTAEKPTETIRSSITSFTLTVIGILVDVGPLMLLLTL